jgi:hypothetical protein
MKLHSAFTFLMRPSRLDFAQEQQLGRDTRRVKPEEEGKMKETKENISSIGTVRTFLKVGT